MNKSTYEGKVGFPHDLGLAGRKNTTSIPRRGTEHLESNNDLTGVRQCVYPDILRSA